jgi:hypothetical protein
MDIAKDAFHPTAVIEQLERKQSKNQSSTLFTVQQYKVQTDGMRFTPTSLSLENYPYEKKHKTN